MPESSGRPSWLQPPPADPAEREAQQLATAELYATFSDHPEPGVRRLASGRERTLRRIVRHERLLRGARVRRIGGTKTGRPRARRTRTARTPRAGPDPGEPPGHPAAARLRELALDGAWQRFVVEGGMDPADWQTACLEAVERGALRRWTP